ncbi:TetR family transcriptional regulator [Murinocardiopsis flavida]|uniref:TetR family transcriptional regulator n=1 Tax=Murinocardiopsis flavida TaxID=645275 RepID=A0A2P8DS62_9ACTN|nr:TetR family transcriptional regulator C-terminal domain-containing protein [Murinocardiopsis flavida]PSL00050.1 TetR family transcriptional regulator [Murinocardiopsis flavida]
MPKIVDHDARRRELGEAFWRVVLSDGVEAASVRTVAAEAGYSAASLRYYFPTQDELLDYTWQMVLDRALARVGALALPAVPVEAALLVSEQSVPMDAERAAEAQLWFSVAAVARTNERLRARLEEVHATLRDGCIRIVAGLQQVGACHPDRDPTAEGIRLHALIDGLAFHGATLPGVYTPAQMRAMLRSQLDDLRSAPV